ncbi:hypothetical protein IWX90DRAFT_224030 [Phyllosticta citrichinensis]|uniref:Uncharacterized protein n=1 Tax=Phyllosticta citrichinensis TaxID=1130410 RepID=A0ABR1XU98_9PEZI
MPPFPFKSTSSSIDLYCDGVWRVSRRKGESGGLQIACVFFCCVCCFVVFCFAAVLCPKFSFVLSLCCTILRHQIVFCQCLLRCVAPLPMLRLLLNCSRFLVPTLQTSFTPPPFPAIQNSPSLYLLSLPLCFPVRSVYYLSPRCCASSSKIITATAVHI